MMPDVPLTRGLTSQIDACDTDLLEINWYAKPSRTTWYARTNIPWGKGQRGLMLHRVIMERILGRSLQPGELVDHEDLNGLNNTRTNLRLATPSQNAANKGIPRNNTSGLKGVCWHKHSGKWAVSVKYQGRRIWVGLFEDLNKAGEAYDRAARDIQGEFARLNAAAGGA